MMIEISWLNVIYVFPENYFYMFTNSFTLEDNIFCFQNVIIC